MAGEGIGSATHATGGGPSFHTTSAAAEAAGIFKHHEGGPAATHLRAVSTKTGAKLRHGSRNTDPDP